MSNNYKIYKITNKINDKCYIGLTKNSLSERFSQHKSDAKINMSIKKGTPILCHENGEIYHSIEQARKSLSIGCYKSIVRVLRGLKKSTKGYSFSYVNKD